jgi:hypothetical protein
MLLSLKTAPCNGGSSFLSLPRFCFYPISGPVQGTLARQRAPDCTILVHS